MLEKNNNAGNKNMWRNYHVGSSLSPLNGREPVVKDQMLFDDNSQTIITPGYY